MNADGSRLHLMRTYSVAFPSVFIRVHLWLILFPAPVVTPAPPHYPPPMDLFRIANFSITNRLFVGTGKYQSYEIMQKALEASACQVVTVAVRRERLVDKEGRSLLDF